MYLKNLEGILIVFNFEVAYKKLFIRLLNSEVAIKLRRCLIVEKLKP